MIGNYNKWGESSISFLHKKVHSKSIISISPRDDHLFYTSSQDNTLRLWDIRLHSSVKLIRNQYLRSLTNCENDGKWMVFVGGERFVYGFDVRKEDVFIEDVHIKNQQEHFDDLSILKYNSYEGLLAAGDDQGDIRLYNDKLQCVELLDQCHINIVNAIDFIKTDKEYYCVTGGFDSKIVYWKMSDGTVAKEIDLQDLFNKHQIKYNNLPFIYCLYAHKNTLYVTTENGFLIAFPFKDLKKPKYIFEASMSRIVQVKVPLFNQNLLITLSYLEGCFTLFDHTKRTNGGPSFLQKYKCHQNPNSIEIIGNQIIISNNNNSELSFFGVK